MKTLIALSLAVLSGTSLLAGNAYKNDPIPQSPPPLEMHPYFHLGTISTRQPAKSSSGGSIAAATSAFTPAGYSPAQICTAYGIQAGNTAGVGQTIAIVNAYGNPTLLNDVNVFSNQFHLPLMTSSTLKIHYTGTKPPSTVYCDIWAFETTLDVEWAHAIAPGAKIMAVIAPTASVTDLITAVDYAVANGAKTICMSWGGAEWSGESYYDSHFKKTGVNFVASSGDTGAGVEWPAVSPYVIGVGGTTLRLTAANTISSEVGWTGSGGGVSLYEPRPAYQSGWLNQNTKRGVPDVSYNADPSTPFAVYITKYCNLRGWLAAGGTSCGSPQWAGLLASGKNLRTKNYTYGSTLLYDLANLNYSLYFRDVQSGSDGAYTAGAKYDYVTGLGSPVANQIALEFGY